MLKVFKSALCVILCAVTVCGVLPFTASSAAGAAATDETGDASFDASTFDYNSLYVTDGLVTWYDFADATADMGKWTETVVNGSSVRTTALGTAAYNDAYLTAFMQSTAAHTPTGRVTFSTQNHGSSSITDETYNTRGFGDGYLSLGYNSPISFADNVVKDGDSSNPDYSIEVIYSSPREYNTNTVMFGETRFGLVTKDATLQLATCYASDGMRGTRSWTDSGHSVSVKIQNAADAPLLAVTATIDRLSYQTGSDGKLNSGKLNSNYYLHGARIGGYDDLVFHDSCGNKVGEFVQMKIYAIRVYNRAITEAEVAQNHFADMAKRLSLDVSKYLLQDDEVKNSVHNAFLSVKMTDVTAAEAQKTIDSITDPPRLDDYSPYIPLYVQEGLTVFFDAFSMREGDTLGTVLADAFGGSISLTQGDCYAVWDDGTQSTATWKAANGGVYINSAGVLDFGNVLDCSDDYTVEIFSAYNDDGITAYDFENDPKSYQSFKPDGVTPNTNSDWWGGYRRDALHLGRLRVTYTLSPTAPGGNIQAVYIRYSGYLNENATLRGNKTCYSTPAVDPFIAPYGVGFGLTVTAQYTARDYVMESNEIADAHASVGYSKNAAVPVTGEYLLAADDDNHLRIGNRTAMTVSAVRVYDRALSEEEISQNHFADMMAYFRTAPSVIDGVSANVLKQFYKRFRSASVSKYTKDSFEEELHRLISIGDVYDVSLYMEFAGIQARTAGAPSMRAAFAVDETAIRLFEDLGYSFEYGILGAPASEAKKLFVAYDERVGHCVFPLKVEGSVHQIAYTTAGGNALGCYSTFDGTSGVAVAEIPTTAAATEEYLFIGYIMLCLDSGERVYLTLPAESALFPEGFSLDAVSRYFAQNGYSENQTILAGFSY